MMLAVRAIRLTHGAGWAEMLNIEIGELVIGIKLGQHAVKAVDIGDIFGGG